MLADARPLPADGRRARGETSRRAILDAAIRCITDDGVSTLTHRSVAAAGGLSPARVAYHFPTVDDLLAAASSAFLDDFDRRLRTMADAALAGERSIVEVCTDVLHDLVSSGARAFLGMVEVRLALARRGRSIDGGGIVELISGFGADEDRARAIAAAMFGFAVLAASEPAPVPRRVVRDHVRTVLGVDG
jgi:AcrR family transcriptional regulator